MDSRMQMATSGERTVANAIPAIPMGITTTKNTLPTTLTKPLIKAAAVRRLVSPWAVKIFTMNTLIISKGIASIRMVI